MDDLDKIARPDVPGHEIRTFYTSVQDITAYVLATSGIRDAEKAVRARVAELRDVAPPVCETPACMLRGHDRG
jgi:hypothetical protein